MAKNDIEKYIEELKRVPTEETSNDLYSLKKELSSLSNSSKIFDNLEKEFAVIDMETLNQIKDFGLLVKIRNLASETKSKKQINDKLHSLHFQLSILKNSMTNSSIKNALGAFLYDNETKIDTLIHELNDFKNKINEIKKHHLNLLQKSLDNKLLVDSKYGKHIDKLHSIHKKQKDALISITRLFLKLTKNHIKKLNASLLYRKHLPTKI